MGVQNKPVCPSPDGPGDLCQLTERNRVQVAKISGEIYPHADGAQDAYRFEFILILVWH